MILDVGCGNKPRGDVNVDLYMKSTIHRGYSKYAYYANLKPERIPNLVRADAQHLPFRNNAFREANCSDLMEHRGINPKKLVDELLRVVTNSVVLTVPTPWNWEQIPKRNKAHARVFRRRDLGKLFYDYPNYVEECQWIGIAPFFPFIRVPSSYRVRIWKKVE